MIGSEISVEKGRIRVLSQMRKVRGGGANLFGISEIVSGTARGADSLGERYARAHNIPVKRFPAQWNTYGKSAGYRRNIEMAIYADACICFQVNNSRGTEHMINIASSKGLQLITIRLQL